MSTEEWSHPVFKTREEFDARVAEVAAQEAQEPFIWWYLSFADDTGFLGGLYIEAHGISDAIQRAWATGVNPGGEVAAWPITDTELFEKNVPPENRGRLLAREEVN